ncbi:hypothetical protein SpCBS45565_g07562 [Spizellomyces sp. 'palustris']|nr:hypothetical protein SpCBS45565_g07562 [Spizellomyces sp. 'palustris']
MPQLLRLALAQDPALRTSRYLLRLATYVSTSTEADKQLRTSHVRLLPHLFKRSPLALTQTGPLRASTHLRQGPVTYQCIHSRERHGFPSTIRLPSCEWSPNVHIAQTRFRGTSKRHFHATPIASKTLLTGAIVTVFFKLARTVVTALPILWRWQWFKSYPRTMWTMAALPVVGIVGLVGLAYEEHPFTQRSRLMFIDEPTELQMAESSYPQLLSQYQRRFVPSSDSEYTAINEIATSLLDIVGPIRDWKLHVVKDDDVVNAFVTPTGKIFVFTGLLRMADDLDAVAAILAHELAHVLSRHGAEKMGFQYLARLGWDFVHSLLYTFTLNLPMLGDLAGRGVDATKDILSSLPYSRMCEKEADAIGLYLMSIAGYNPRAAVSFWNQLSSHDSSTPTYEFLSDHPSHAHRAEDLRTHLPAALKIYHARQHIAVEFEQARLSSAKRVEGVGKRHWHSIDDLNRELCRVLNSYVGRPLFGEETFIEKSLEVLESDDIKGVVAA